MPARAAFDYAAIRVVPRPDREEFINAGVVIRCIAQGFLAARVGLDRARLAALAADADPEPIERHLEAFARVAAGAPDAGPIAALPLRERWHWLTTPRSTVVQPGPVHAGLCDDAAAALAKLFERLVGRKRP